MRYPSKSWETDRSGRGGAEQLEDTKRKKTKFKGPALRDQRYQALHNPFFKPARFLKMAHNGN